MEQQGHLFGGGWTEQKLEIVKSYLQAYTQIMKDQPFEVAYIDAFAGTGYRTEKDDTHPYQLALPELADEAPRAFRDGSARIALQIEPPFSKYIFVEKSPAKLAQLERLKVEFPNRADRIQTENEDANLFLERICGKNWLATGRRAVLFLDPFGMQVSWSTIEAVAATKAIDMWYLFPLGMGVMRMLKNDGDIDPEWRRKLDDFFGTNDWYQAFYRRFQSEGLFWSEADVVKVADRQLIADYFINRLQTVFSGVADNPAFLVNAKGFPLYALCFAAGNPRGAPLAIKVAGHILDKI